MEEGKTENKWERTNVTNLLRNRESGTYYARVKVNGKQKWRTLKTTVSSVAKLRLADKEREIRDQSQTATGEAKTTGTGQMTMGHLINVYLARVKADASLAPATKERRATAMKAVKTTWPDLAERDVRRVSAVQCRTWAADALREGTGFIAPNVKSRRKGMASSSFNKAVDALRAVFELAREDGAIYKNPAGGIAKAPVKQKHLELPTVGQFQAIAKRIGEAGSKWSIDCRDLVRFLAYSGVRLREATAIRWSHVDQEKRQVTVPGTKSASSYRVIPIFPALDALLKEIQERRGDEAPNAAILRVGGCRGALESACEAEGVKRMNHHDLRHLFATRCIESGVDIPTVSRWLGHSDGGALAMKTYGHLRQEHSQTQAAKVSF